MAESAEYRFDCEVVDRSLDPYFVTRWDLAKPVAVVAATEAEAYQKIWAMKGPAPSGRTWVARVKRITDVRLTQEDGA